MCPSAGVEEEEHGFAERLKAEIERSNYSHRGLATEIGASKQSVTNWTQGHSEPSLKNLRRLASALRVPPALLLEGDGHSDQSPDATLVDLLAELTASPARPDLRALNDSVPGLLDLLARAERRIRK